MYRTYIIATMFLIFGAMALAFGYVFLSYSESITDSSLDLGIETRIQKLKDLNDIQYRLIRDDDRISYNLGVLSFKNGELGESITFFQNVLRSSENAELRARAHYNIGVILLRIFRGYGDPASREAAIEQFQNALRENPNEEDARYNLEKMYGTPIAPETDPENPDDSPGDHYGEGIPEEDF